MGKRYYWLKLPDDFFRQKPIKKLRRIAGGDTYTIIYLKMLLVSLKNEGKLFFDGVEENFTEEIALELDEEEENVKVTVQFLMAQGLLQLIDESEYELTECSRMVGSESASAERMRRLRDKKTSQCDIGVTQQLHLSDVEKEIEIDKDKEIENKYICPEVNSGQPQPKAEIEPVAESRTKVEIEPSCSKAELKVETEPAQADVFIKLPLINGANRLTGALVGVAKGIVFLWIALLILTVLCSTETGKTGLALVEKDSFLRVVYRYDVLVNAFLQFFGK